MLTKDLLKLKQILAGDFPAKTLRELDKQGVLVSWLPEITNLHGVLQDPKWHPEGDAFVHTMLVLEKAAELTRDPAVRFAALTHDLGKGLTPKHEWPKHVNHEVLGVPLVVQVCERLGVPKSWKTLAVFVAENHLRIHKAQDMRPGKLWGLITSLTKNKEPQFMSQVLMACAADNYGKLQHKYPPADLIRLAAEVLGGLRKATEFGETTEMFKDRQIRAVAYCLKGPQKSAQLPDWIGKPTAILSGKDVTRITGLTGNSLSVFMREFMPVYKKVLPGLSKADIHLLVLKEFAFKNAPKDMDLYVVGGAVRDTLLGAPVKDIDFLVAGETPESMLARGFNTVGKDFPVFLDDTGNQFALARTEQSTGQKHTDYIVNTKNVTVEDDLFRRDLTINAIALSRDGKLVDPHRGQDDLNHKTSGRPEDPVHVLLRPVSDHFWEDPLRVLRVARQFGKLASLGFTPIMDDAFAFAARKKVQAGILSALPKERIFQEFSEILSQAKPSEGLGALQTLGVWDALFPNFLTKNTLDSLLNSADHTARETRDPAFVFGSICAGMSEKNRAQVCEILGVPALWQTTANRVAQGYDMVRKQGSAILTPKDTFTLLTTLQAYKHPDAFEKGLHTLFVENTHVAHYKNCADVSRQITGARILEEAAHEGHRPTPGPWVGQALEQKRLAWIGRVISETRQAKTPLPGQDELDSYGR